MNLSSQKQFSDSVRNNYDRLSSIYDLISGSTERKFIHHTIQQLNLQERTTCLEIGCGTGTGLLELTEKFPLANKIVAIDISLGMCQKSKIKFGKSNGDKPPNICQADGFSLPFRTAEFDLVFMSFTFELIPEHLYPSLCGEISRVLKSDGIFSSVNIMTSETKNPIFALYKWGHVHYPKLIDCRPIDSAVILRSHGFNNFSTQTYNLWGIPVASVIASKNPNKS